MLQERENIDDVERATVERLNSVLRDYVVVSHRVCNAVNLAMAGAPDATFKDVPQSRRVAMNLMIRLANELRCIILLAIRGYPLQAASLVASLWEVAHTIAYVGGDDVRAKDWVAHNDPKRPFQSAFSLTADVVKSLDGVSDPQGMIARAYKVYQGFCQAKHSNPLLQQHFGHYMTDEFVVAMNGPDESEAALSLARSTLKRASQLTLIGVASYFDNQAPEARIRLQPRIDEIRMAIDALAG